MRSLIAPSLINSALIKSTLTSAALMLLCNICFAAEDVSSSPVQWPNGTKAAVSLAYDDTLNSQLDTAVPQLDKYNFKASFYLFLGSPVMPVRLDDWRKLSSAGHELGNHTLNHGCSKSKPYHDWVDDWNDLDKRTVAEMEREVQTANTFLTAIDGKTTRTFTAPCGEISVSDGDYTQAVQNKFIAIKSGINSQPQRLEDINPYAVNLWTPAGVSGQELISYVKQAAEMGTIANITFHGIGADHMQVSAEAHEQLLRYLDANRDTYWVDTFTNIMTHFKQGNSQEVKR